MKILQLTGDWKWTGPAEPMVRLAEALRARGLQVALAYPAPPHGVEPARSLASEAKAAGLPSVVPVEAGQGARWRRDAAAVARLRDYLDRSDIDLIHCWHTRDHLMAIRAARARRRAGRTVVVRSYRSAGRIPRHPWNRWLFGAGTDGLLCVSPGTAHANASLRGGRPMIGCLGAVDLGRFRPAPRDAALRRELGLAAEHRVVGVVARMQRHRRFDLLLAAAVRLFAADPLARLLVVGRGTHAEGVAVQPARRLGIADRVVFAGYRTGDLAAVLLQMDLITMLVPGSDGTCRALLEGAASGVPAVTTRRGALPEIVIDGETGCLVDEDPEALAAAWIGLLADEPARRRLGAAARQRAETHFDPAGWASRVAAFYEEVRASV